MTNIEIARRAKLRKIADLAKERFGIDDRHIEPYGHYKAKLSLEYLDSLQGRKDGHLILVTAITPTPAGEGKTTTTIGLGDALNGIGKETIICLREPSLGPCFGMKGGAAGGGYAQVVPMEDINLHFTGDFHAISLAHNLLSALIDNHIHHGDELDFDVRRICWNRVVDLNDRSLRKIMVGLGGTANGYPREDSFDIVVASEVMAILCLSNSVQDLRNRLGNMIVGYSHSKKPILAKELYAHGAMAVLLKDAIKPNLVQTLENNLALIHGGPFANIAHGCNSVIATAGALKLADYVVTEAGFGADLGAEKFVDIKCRKSGLRPSLVVLVATIRALKYHGGAEKTALDQENLETLEKGIVNLERHMNNVRNHFGLPCVVAINRFTHDTEAEIKLLKKKVAHHGVLKNSPKQSWMRSTQRRLISVLSTKTPRLFGRRSIRLPQKSTALLKWWQILRSEPGSNSIKMKATVTTLSALPRRSTLSRQTRSCVGRRPVMSFRLKRFAWLPEQNSWLSFAGIS